MDITKQFGPGVYAMTFRTQYEIETDTAVELSGKLRRLVEQRQQQLQHLQRQLQQRQLQQHQLFGKIAAKVDNLHKDTSLADLVELSAMIKSFNAGPVELAGLDKSMDEILAAQAELKKALDRRDAAFPEFRMWFLAQHCGPAPAPRSFCIADKASDASKGERALSPLPKPTTQMDPSLTVGEAVLRRRPDRRSF